MIIAKQIEPYLMNLRGAIHIGAHLGEECDWYNQMGFTGVVWFEANPELYPKLTQNLKLYENQVAFNFGIHDSLEEAPLHISSNDGESSSLLELGVHAKYHPNVTYVKDVKAKFMRLDSFFKKWINKITDYNFLNIDVQGTELNVLLSLGKEIAKLDYVYLEVNDEELYKGCALIPEVDEYLRQFNFIRVVTHFTKAHWGDAFYKRYAG